MKLQNSNLPKIIQKELNNSDSQISDKLDILEKKRSQIQQQNLKNLISSKLQRLNTLESEQRDQSFERYNFKSSRSQENSKLSGLNTKSLANLKEMKNYFNSEEEPDRFDEVKEDGGGFDDYRIQLDSSRELTNSQRLSEEVRPRKLQILLPQASVNHINYNLQIKENNFDRIKNQRTSNTIAVQQSNGQVQNIHLEQFQKNKKFNISLGSQIVTYYDGLTIQNNFIKNSMVQLKQMKYLVTGQQIQHPLKKSSVEIELP